MEMYIESADNEKQSKIEFCNSRREKDGREERERERERDRERVGDFEESFHFIMKGHWQILSSYQPTVNYAKDDLQIQLPSVSRKDD